MHTSDHSAMHHLIHIVHHAVQQITQGELENEQEGFELIIQAKQRSQSESLETDIVQLATPSVVAVGTTTSRWASIVSSALAANFILLVKRPESETLWLGQKMLLLLCAQSLCPEDTDKVRRGCWLCHRHVTNNSSLLCNRLFYGKSYTMNPRESWIV